MTVRSQLGAARAALFPSTARCCLAALILAAAAGCNSQDSTQAAAPAAVPPATATEAATVTVSPGVATAAIGGAAVAFTATSSTNGGITWQVNGVTGGNASVGTISPTGTYMSPDALPSPAVVTITAVAADASAKSASATLTLTAPQQVGDLMIAGTPSSSVRAGQAYTFTPVASAPPGASLTFSIANKPAWATFSPTTGKLSGTPASTDIGSYANVAISVSDGTSAASLLAFTVTVTGGAMGSATLSWSAPATRTDGTPLKNLAGFKIYYGKSLGNYPNRISVANPGLTTYVVDNLPSGTYYFVATAVDSSGVESDLSGVASKTIP